MKKILFLPILLSLLLSGDLFFGKAPIYAKPFGSVAVSITPAVEGVQVSQLKEGESIAMRVEAIPFVNADLLEVEVKLAPGLELVSGDLNWHGPVVKKETVTLSFTVRVTKKGKGLVKAKATLFAVGAEPFTHMASLQLGKREKREGAKAAKTKKDRQGRKIIEYRR